MQDSGERDVWRRRVEVQHEPILWKIELKQTDDDASGIRKPIVLIISAVNTSPRDSVLVLRPRS